MEQVLSYLAEQLTQNLWLAPLIALAAGFLASLLPCSLSAIPLVIAYVGAQKEGANCKLAPTHRSFLLSLSFALGSALTLTTLGVLASLVGSALYTRSRIALITFAILMIIMALQMFGLIHINLQPTWMSRFKKAGYVGAFIFGLVGGLFASSCSTPVLIALLTVIASVGNLALGVLLMFCYALGHGFLAVVAGTLTGSVRALNRSESYGHFAQILQYILGVLIAGLGIYLFYLAL